MSNASNFLSVPGQIQFRTLITAQSFCCDKSSLNFPISSVAQLVEIVPQNSPKVSGPSYTKSSAKTMRRKCEPSVRVLGPTLPDWRNVGREDYQLQEPL